MITAPPPPKQGSVAMVTKGQDYLILSTALHFSPDLVRDVKPSEQAHQRPLEAGGTRLHDPLWTIWLLEKAGFGLI